ncbi:MAG: carbohydrate-binding family 9-like protein [Mucilaginibacter polytrichastri]|nr:carbohydrate-binding family 9-like protein [Mucilaginibacter polytrichastri]
MGRRFIFRGEKGLLLAICLSASAAKAQTAEKSNPDLFSVPKTYHAVFTTENITIDGKPDEKAWEAAAWSDDFVDIEGKAKPLPALRTRLKMLWGDTCLYILAEMEEPHIWANLKKHDAIVYHDNDFEVFIDPSHTTHNYYEIEVNALNTIFDLFMPRPYRNGGNALIGYDVQGLRSAVQVNGTVNDPSDTDKGWTVEMAIPFNAVLPGVEPQKPKPGDAWRINFSRVEWDTDVKDGRYVKKTGEKGKPLPERNWVWSPQGAINMHMPERWGYVYFGYEKTGVKTAPDQAALTRLWSAYYAQQKHYRETGSYAGNAVQLGLKAADGITIEATKQQFIIRVQSAGNTTYQLNQEGYFSIKK